MPVNIKVDLNEIRPMKTYDIGGVKHTVTHTPVYEDGRVTHHVINDCPDAVAVHLLAKNPNGTAKFPAFSRIEPPKPKEQKGGEQKPGQTGSGQEKK